MLDSHVSTPTPGTGASADPTLPDHPVATVLDVLQHSARKLRATANELAEQPPTPAVFTAVEKLTEDILKLREPALEAAAQETIDALLADLAKYLTEKSQTATWLVANVDSIVAEWRSAYPLQDVNLSDELQVCIRRAKRDFDKQLERCAVADAQERNARDALDLHDSAMNAKGVPSRADLELLDRQSDAHSATRRAVFVARRDAVNALRQSLHKCLSRDDTEKAITAQEAPDKIPIDAKTFRKGCARRVMDALDCKLTQLSSARFSSNDDNIAVVCLISKQHRTSSRVRYWFGFVPPQKKWLEEAQHGFLALGCGSPDSVLLIPFRELVPLLANMHSTNDSDGRTVRWHIDIRPERDRPILRRRKGSLRLDLSRYLV